MNRKELKNKLGKLADYARNEYYYDTKGCEDDAITSGELWEQTEKEILSALRFWIPVSERLPKVQGNYLTLYFDGSAGYNPFYTDTKEFLEYHNDVIAWAYIPAYIPEVTE